MLVWAWVSFCHGPLLGHTFILALVGRAGILIIYLIDLPPVAPVFSILLVLVGSALLISMARLAVLGVPLASNVPVLGERVGL